MTKKELKCRYCNNSDKIEYGICDKCWSLIDQPNKIKYNIIKKIKMGVKKHESR